MTTDHVTYKFQSYITKNTVRVVYEGEPVNAAEGNYRYLLTRDVQKAWIHYVLNVCFLNISEGEYHSFHLPFSVRIPLHLWPNQKYKTLTLKLRLLSFFLIYSIIKNKLLYSKNYINICICSKTGNFEFVS